MLGYVRVLTKGSSSILERLKAFKRDKCFCLRNLIYGYTKNMCLSKAEIQAIKERVNNTEEGAQSLLTDPFRFSDFSHGHV